MYANIVYQSMNDCNLGDLFGSVLYCCDVLLECSANNNVEATSNARLSDLGVIDKMV